MYVQTFLTNCFTSLLLKTYFIRKQSLTINTLEEVVNDLGISVAGRVGLLGIKSLKPEFYDILNKRVINYENKLGIDSWKDANLILSEIVLKGVINQKTVILLPLKDAILYEILYPKLKAAELKYSPQYYYWYISKNHPRKKRIYQA